MTVETMTVGVVTVETTTVGTVETETTTVGTVMVETVTTGTVVVDIVSVGTVTVEGETVGPATVGARFCGALVCITVGMSVDGVLVVGDTCTGAIPRRLLGIGGVGNVVGAGDGVGVGVAVDGGVATPVGPVGGEEGGGELTAGVGSPGVVVVQRLELVVVGSA